MSLWGRSFVGMCRKWRAARLEEIARVDRRDWEVERKQSEACINGLCIDLFSMLSVTSMAAQASIDPAISARILIRQQSGIHARIHGREELP